MWYAVKSGWKYGFHTALVNLGPSRKTDKHTNRQIDREKQGQNTEHNK